MRKKTLWCVIAVCFIELSISAQPPQTTLKPIKVEVRLIDSSYKLFRDGKPYFIKGAGGSGYLSRLAAYGGNSIRTWGTRNGQQILDSAHKYGLTVLMGLGVTPERHNFNYDDTAAVTKQFETILHRLFSPVAKKGRKGASLIAKAIV